MLYIYCGVGVTYLTYVLFFFFVGNTYRRKRKQIYVLIIYYILLYKKKTEAPFPVGREEIKKKLF